MIRYDPANDYYARLGAADTVKPEELRVLHRMRVQLFHPDGHRAPELATREMKLLNEAWETLRDPVRRREYDQARATYFMSRMQPAIEQRVDTEARRRQTTKSVRKQPPSTSKKTPKQRTRTSRPIVPPARPFYQPIAVSPPPTAAARPSGFLAGLARRRVGELRRQGRSFEAFLLEFGARYGDAQLASWANDARRDQTTKRKKRRTRS